MKVTLDCKEWQYTIKDDNLPTQTIDFSEYNEWNSIKDHDGNEIYDCQVWWDEEFGFQFVNLIPDPDNEGYMTQGGDWGNPDEFIVLNSEYCPYLNGEPNVVNKGFPEIKGDLVKMALNGDFDVIIHGCNCFHVMSAGIAPQINNAFDGIPLQIDKATEYGDYNKLGTYSLVPLFRQKGEFGWTLSSLKTFRKYYKDPKYEFKMIVNCYTQYTTGARIRPLDYDALRLCLRKINRQFPSDYKIGIPQIGCGLAGGDWSVVKKMINEEMKDSDVTIVIFE